MWPRTSVRIPALSIAGTPLRSTRTTVSASKQLLQMPPEGFRGAAGYEGFHRRHDDPVADRLMSI